MAATKANSIVMTEGRPLPQIIRFSVPLALTGILQLLFNAADVIVVGKFDSSTALAAVGATTSLINLLIGAFIGISVGVNILVARYLGCRDDERVSRSVHTSVVLGLGLGVVVFLLGFFLASPLLRLMDTPEDVLPLSDPVSADLLYRRTRVASLQLLRSGTAGLRRHEKAVFLSVHLRHSQCTAESVFRSRLPARRGGRCDCDGRLTVSCAGARAHLPDAAGGLRAAGTQKTPLLPGRGPAHDPDRPACRSAVRHFQHFQCHDPVLDQLLWRGRGRGEPRRQAISTRSFIRPAIPFITPP